MTLDTFSTGPCDDFQVMATVPQSVCTNLWTSLNGSVTKLGVPLAASQVDATWSVRSTPPGGEVHIYDVEALSTRAYFTKPGSYRLRLHAKGLTVLGAGATDITVNVLSDGCASPKKS